MAPILRDSTPIPLPSIINKLHKFIAACVPEMELLVARAKSAKAVKPDAKESSSSVKSATGMKSAKKKQEKIETEMEDLHLGGSASELGADEATDRDEIPAKPAVSKKKEEEPSAAKKSPAKAETAAKGVADEDKENAKKGTAQKTKEVLDEIRDAAEKYKDPTFWQRTWGVMTTIGKGIVTIWGYVKPFIPFL